MSWKDFEKLLFSDDRTDQTQTVSGLNRDNDDRQIQPKNQRLVFGGFSSMTTPQRAEILPVLEERLKLSAIIGVLKAKDDGWSKSGCAVWVKQQRKKVKPRPDRRIKRV